MWLSVKDFKAVLNDFTLGLSVFITQLSIKLSFWNDLPFSLARLMDPIESLARAGAVACKQQYQAFVNAHGDAAESKCHPITWNFFNGTCGLQVDLFIDGTPRASLLTFWVEILNIGLLFVVERLVEGTHAIIKKICVFRGVLQVHF